MPIKVALVDDHQLFRKLLAGYLNNHKDIDVAIEAGDAKELFVKLDNVAIDILLLDLYMPKMSGIDIAAILQNAFPQVKIIVISLMYDLNMAKSLLDIGIYAYLSKNEDPNNVLNAIRAVYENRIYKNAIFTEALYISKETEIRQRSRKSENALDEREKQIIQLLWEEKSNKEISELVYLSVSSIEKIKQELKEKLDVRTIAGLIKYGLLNGIISLKETVK